MKCHLCNSELVIKYDADLELSSHFKYIWCKNCGATRFNKCGIELHENKIVNYILYYKKYDCFIYSFKSTREKISKIFYVENDGENFGENFDYIKVDYFMPLNMDDDLNKHIEKVFNKIKTLNVFK